MHMGDDGVWDGLEGLGDRRRDYARNTARVVPDVLIDLPRGALLNRETALDPTPLGVLNRGSSALRLRPLLPSVGEG